MKRVLNLGAGTQSSVLLMMVERGMLPPIDVAIFADTQAEPKEVYDHLEWLKQQVKNTPIVTVSAGNLEKDGIDFRQNRVSVDSTTGRKGYASIPLFVLNNDGSKGIIRRQCTSEYKIAPITKYIRETILGLAKGQRAAKGVQVQQIFGISFDERERMRESEHAWCVYDYPLVDMKMHRQQVIDLAAKWFPDHYFPRSACYFCPYKSNEEWRRMRDEMPEEWDRAIWYDIQIRQAGEAGQKRKGILTGIPFLHRQCVPLDQADIRSDDEKNGQRNLFGMLNECEGMCGV